MRRSNRSPDTMLRLRTLAHDDAGAAALEAAWLPQGLDCSDVDWLAQPLMKPSGVVSGLVEADGLVICAENREGLTAGERVRVELLA